MDWNCIHKTFKRLMILRLSPRQRIRNIVWSSTICGVINTNSFRNSGQVKVLLYVLCVEMTNFGASWAIANLDQKVVKTELLFSGFLVQHNLPLSTADHASKLFRNMFPDSKIVNKCRCGLTKTTQILTGALSKQILVIWKSCCWLYGTD